MPFLEPILRIIAPFECLICGSEGDLLCVDCTGAQLVKSNECYRCGRVGSSMCKICSRPSPLAEVWICCTYTGIAKDLIHRLKFERAKAAARTVARAMYLQQFPIQAGVVVSVPTAAARVRARGYDQARLIAKQYARLTGLRYASLLRRTGQSRQVGASRSQRQSQATGLFVCHTRLSSDQAYILVDDVVTTGATIEAAAQVLIDAGAKTVIAVCFAQQPKNNPP